MGETRAPRSAYRGAQAGRHGLGFTLALTAAVAVCAMLAASAARAQTGDADTAAEPSAEESATTSSAPDPAAANDAAPAAIPPEGLVIFEHPLTSREGMRVAGGALDLPFMDGKPCFHLVTNNGKGNVEVDLPLEQTRGMVLRATLWIRGVNIPDRFNLEFPRINFGFKNPTTGKFETFGDAKYSGTFGWTRIDAVGRVPDEANNVVFAVRLRGEGAELWARDLRVTGYSSVPVEYLVMADTLDDSSLWSKTGERLERIEGQSGTAVRVGPGSTAIRMLDLSAFRGRALQMYAVGRVYFESEEITNWRGIVRLKRHPGNQIVFNLGFEKKFEEWMPRSALFHVPEDGGMFQIVVTRGDEKAPVEGVWFDIDTLVLVEQPMLGAAPPSGMRVPSGAPAGASPAKAGKGKTGQGKAGQGKGAGKAGAGKPAPTPEEEVGGFVIK